MSDEMHTSDDVTVVLVHGAFADASSWSGVIERLQPSGRHGHGPRQPAPRHRDRLRLHRRPCSSRRRGRSSLVGHSYGGAVITNAAAAGRQRRRPGLRGGLRPRRGRASRRGRGRIEGQRPERRAHPTSIPVADGGTATEFSIDPAKTRNAFAGDLSDEQAALIAAVQRPIAEAGVLASRPGRRPGRTCRPGPSLPPATRPPVPTSSARWRSGPVPRSPRSRART